MPKGKAVVEPEAPAPVPETAPAPVETARPTNAELDAEREALARKILDNERARDTNRLVEIETQLALVLAKRDAAAKALDETRGQKAGLEQQEHERAADLNACHVQQRRLTDEIKVLKSKLAPPTPPTPAPASEADGEMIADFQGLQPGHVCSSYHRRPRRADGEVVR